MRPIGKVGKRWLATRKKWLKEHQPNYQGYYVCHYCGHWLLVKELELDHVKSRSRYPELRFDISNLVPACGNCNAIKGSREWKAP